MKTNHRGDISEAAWVESKFLWGWECSECGNSVYAEFAGECDDEVVPFDYGWHYCPYCGAHITTCESRLQNLRKGVSANGETIIYLDYAD